MKSLKQAALSGARWTIAARVGLQLVTWPITIVVMRLLAPDDYGVFAIAMLVHGFITLFSELGLGVALVQAPEVSESQSRMAATLVLSLNVAIALAIVLLAPWVGDWYEAPEVTAVMWALTAELALASVAAVPLALLERELRLREISIAQIAGGIAGAAATLLAAIAEAGVWALVAGALTNAFVRSALCILAYGRIVLPGRLNLSDIRPMVRISGHAMAIRVLWYWTSQADSLILGLRLHAYVLGAYNVASQLAMLPAGKAMEAVNRVAFPVLCRLRDDAAGLQAAVARLRALLALYGFGVCWGLAALAPEFVSIVLGPKWMIAQFPLAALALVAPLRMLAAFNNTVVTAAGAPEAATRELLLAAALIPGAVGLGAWWGGLQGASMAWPLAYLIVFAVSTSLTSVAIRQQRRAAIRPLLAPLVAGTAMMGCIWALRSLAEAAAGVPLAALVTLQITLGAAVYMGVLWLGARTLLIDTRTLVLDLALPKRTA